MSNNDQLTAEEFDAFRLHPLVLDRLEACRQKTRLSKADFHIVDWGCGRGKTVLWLREQGYAAYGVDVDSRPFANGIDLFRRKGHRFEECIGAMDQRGIAPFPDGFFHFVLSDQVLEHITDLDAAIAEMRRLMAAGAEGVHIFPPHRRLVEPHLYMPCVHWLPKGPLRKCAIALCILAGIEPHWWPPRTISYREKLRAYYAFSVNETFYRSDAEIRAAFVAAGIAAECIDVCNFGFRRTLTDALPFLAPDSRVIRCWYTNFAADLGLAIRSDR